MLFEKALVRQELGSGTYVNANRTDSIIGILSVDICGGERPMVTRRCPRLLKAVLQKCPSPAGVMTASVFTDAAWVEESFPISNCSRFPDPSGSRLRSRSVLTMEPLE